MSGRTDRESVYEKKTELESLFSGSSWFKEVRVDADDGGLHLEVRVTDMQEMIDSGARVKADGVRVLFISVGRPPKEVASA